MTVEWFYVYRLHITNSRIFLIEGYMLVPTYSKVHINSQNIYFFQDISSLKPIFIQCRYYFTYSYTYYIDFSQPLDSRALYKLR